MKVQFYSLIVLVCKYQYTCVNMDKANTRIYKKKDNHK